MNKIVAATDLSTRGAVAVDRAWAIAQATDAELRIIHAVDDDQPQDIVQAVVERATQHLRTEISARGPSVKAEFDVLTGDVHSVLHQTAQAVGADLIVVGDHRRSLLRDIFRDTTVERLARQATIPILLARVAADRPYTRALLGIESGEAEELARTLDSLGASGPKVLIGLHAFDAAAAGLMSYANIPSDKIARYRKDVAEATKRRIWSSLDQSLRDRIRLRIEETDAATALQAVATEEGCELVAVSTHARRGILRSLLGSVCAELIRHGTSDLMIVPRVVKDD